MSRFAERSHKSKKKKPQYNSSNCELGPPVFYAALFYRDYIEILCYWIYVDFTKILCSFILQRLCRDFVLLDLCRFY